MSFEEYLVSKKIDSVLFQKQEPQRWNEWKAEFEVTHPNSFSARKLYLLNPIRRKYKLTIAQPPGGEASPSVAKPVFKPKPKIN